MTTTTHAYGDHPHQFGELTLPAGAGGTPLPVAVLVHGGFWLAEHGLERMRPLAAGLAERGWAAWNVEYRRLGAGSDGGWPQTGQDVSAAVDHLAALAAAGEPVDTARAVSVGHSAGGHLSLLDAARPPADAAVRVVATVGLAPLTDVDRAHALGGDATAVVEAFMGGAPDARPQAYAEVSPVRRVPLGVPQLIVVGDRDELVPPDMVTAYADAARAAGDDVTYDLRPGDGHFEIVEPESAAWAEVVAWLQRY